MKNPSLRRRRAGGRGFTLLETLIAVSLSSLLLLGVIDLFLSAARLTGRTNALASASADGANAVQRVIDGARQAQSLCLPSDAGFRPLPGFSSVGTFYKTTMGTATILTALQINQPAARTPSVLTAGGASVPVAAFDRGATSGFLLFYRGNADQSPNPATGQFLWEYSSATGTAVARCRTVDNTVADAVQFVQPSGGSTQIAVKVVSSSYSPINGKMTTEQTDGSATSALTGKCVLMRDYSTNNTPSADGQTLNHAFQHS